MTALLCIGPDDLVATWPMVKPLIERSYLETDIPMPDVLGWLQAKRGMLWIAVVNDKVVGAVTVSLEPKPSGVACRIGVCGGEDMEAWIGHLAAIEDYAKREGCVKMVVDGRKGWERVLRGYSVKAVTLEKVLDGSSG